MNGVNEEGSVKQYFFAVENPKVLLPILKERHPNSCFVYNQVITSDRYKGELQFHTLLTSEVTPNTWILTSCLREDYGRDISISAPNSVVQGIDQVPDEIKECISLGDVIDWDARMIFVALEKPVSAMIFDIAVNIKACIGEVHPCYLYYMEIEDALQLSLTSGEDVQLSRLSPEKDSQFILSTWKYAREGSSLVVPRCITAYASGGVFLDDKCVSGVIVFPDGLLHCLYTLKDHRNRGFGKLTMHFTFREIAKDGGFPCSTVELRNKRSNAFHESLGVKRLPTIVDYIDVYSPDID